MIKFVCASCQERLSVAEQFAGRKGACPSCGLLNRVPLRGFAEAQGTTLAPPIAPASQRLRITATAVIDQTPTREPTSLAPSLPVSRTIPLASTDAAQLNCAPPVIATANSPADEPFCAPTITADAAPLPAAWIAPLAPATPSDSASGSSFLSSAVAALSDLPEETHEPLYVQRHTLAADQLTPGERWRQAFAAEDIRPSRWNRFLSRMRVARSVADAASVQSGSSHIEDESLPVGFKFGLLLVGALCVAGAVYAALHLMLWLGAGVK